MLLIWLYSFLHISYLTLTCGGRGSYEMKELIPDACVLCKGEPRNRPRRTHRVSGDIAQLFLNLGTRRGCVVSITPRPPLPLGKSRYTLYRRLGGPQSRSG
jgi:hypothetical protein